MILRLIAWWRKPAFADDDRMRSLSVKTPERDADFWDIANHEPEPEPGRVEYRFLDIPYDTGD